MTQFTKSFLWRFILDIILLGIFVRFCQNIILTITSRFISTYSTPFLVIEAIVVSAISMLFICFITYWNIGVISKKDCYHNEEYSMVLRMIISESLKSWRDIVRKLVMLLCLQRWMMKEKPKAKKCRSCV